MGTHEQWAAERVVLGEGLGLDPWLLRADYVMWCSDRRLRPEPMSRMRNVLRALGVRPRGRGEDLRYEGCSLALLEDSGYRAGGHWLDTATPEHVLGALSALKAAGLVTSRWVLNRAWRELQA